MSLPSLRTRALQTILLTFGGLTALIASALVFALNVDVKDDLRGRARVIARALEQSVDVSVGARQGNERQVDRGLSWLSAVGDELLSVVVMTPDGRPIAGVGRDGPVAGTALALEASRRIGYLESEYVGVLGRESAPKADETDPMAAVLEELAAPADRDEPRVRVILTLQGQVLRQTGAIVFTGVMLALIALAALAWIARDTFRRVEPALESAHRMAQGDFAAELGSGEYQELATLFSAMNAISRSLSSTLSGVRALGDEVASAVDRITGAALALRGGADQGTRAVTVAEDAVAAMQRSVDDTTRRLTELAGAAEASSRDTEVIERTNSATGQAVITLRGEVARHTHSLDVIGARAKALSQDAGAVGEAAETARSAALRMQRSAVEGAERAADAARLADGAMQDSQVGGKAIEDAVARIREIATHAGTMEGSLQAFTERVQGMNPVLGAIADVTSRTSLLALNAGIIAAQAGERGAAFQVVVDELKSLASKTAQLTRTVEDSVRTVLEQRGRTDEAASELRRVIAASMEDAHRAGAALDAMRASTAESQKVSAGIAETLSGQEHDVRETLERVDVVDGAGRSVEATARALADEVRVLQGIADRFTSVSDDVARASREQGELAARVGQAQAQLARQVRALTSTQAEQHADVARVERSIGEIRRFAADARDGAAQLETVTERVRQKAAGLADALRRFRTRG